MFENVELYNKISICLRFPMQEFQDSEAEEEEAPVMQSEEEEVPCCSGVRKVREVLREPIDDPAPLALFTVECVGHGRRNALDKPAEEGHHEQVRKGRLVRVHPGKCTKRQQLGKKRNVRAMLRASEPLVQRC